MAILTGRLGLRPVCALLGIFLTLTVWARPLPLWEIADDDSRVLLMGSVHLLRASDYPLRDGLNQAYELADTLTMEIDMSKVSAASSQDAIANISIDPQGRKLRDLVGSDAYEQANGMAEKLGIPLMMFDQFEPWFAALSVTQLRMVQLGFDPAWGVEAVFTRKAVAEQKPMAGLETLVEQLGFMDRLDPQTQKVFLLQSLEDAATVEDEVETVVQAWANGDVEQLENSLLEGLTDAPLLYQALLVERNKNWVAPIQQLLERPGTHLVVVGAMHLVGDNSVLAMLQQSGIESRQLADADF